MIFLFFQHWGPPRCLAKPRGASQCAGVPDPTRVKHSTTQASQIFSLGEGFALLEEGTRRLSIILLCSLRGPLGAFFSLLGAFFGSWVPFGRVLGPSLVGVGIFSRFLSIFARFGLDLGSIWARFLVDFWYIFWMVSEKTNF